MSTRDVYLGLKKNAATIIYTQLASPADADVWIVNPTLAAGDVRVSIDGGAFANLGTLPAVTPAGDVAVKIILTAGEMNGDNVVISFKDQTGTEEWQAHCITIRTRAVTSDDLVRSTIPANALAVDSSGRIDVGKWLGTAVTLSATTALPEVDAKSISNDATAADNCELMFDGTGYAGGTAKLGVDVVAISGDATAADNLESYCDGTTPAPVNAIQISGDATAADNCESMFDGTGYAGGTIKFGVDVTAISGDVTAADNLEAYSDGTTPQPVNVTHLVGSATAGTNIKNAFDGATGFAFTACSMPIVVALTNAVTLDLTQAISEGRTARTVGGALEASEAKNRNRVVDNGAGSTEVVYRSDGTTPLITRNRSSDGITLAP